MDATPTITASEREMLGRRQILIGGEIDSDCANSTIAKLLYLEQDDPVAPISILIDSPGGQITASLPIFDTIEFVEAPVHTYATGQARGSALWLLAAGEPGNRFVRKDTLLSIEATRIETGDPNAQTHLPKLNSTLAKLLASKSSLSDSEILAGLQEGRHFTPTEAIAAGLVDARSEGDPDPDKDGEQVSDD